MSELTLYYHAGSRGLAEKIRILLAETLVRYKEVPVSKDQFEVMKTDGTLNWGTLPVLKDGDKIIEQSSNILEYVATLADATGRASGGNKYLGGAGELPFVRAIVLAVNEFQMEIKTWLGKEAVPQDVLKESINRWFSHFQKVLDKNDDGDARTEEWSFGKHFTMADVAIFEAVNAVIELHGLSNVRPFPKLKAFHDKVAARSRIEHYLATRPKGF